MIWAVLKSYQR